MLPSLVMTTVMLRSVGGFGMSLPPAKILQENLYELHHNTVSFLIAGLVLTNSLVPQVAVATEEHVWQLGNGQVRLEDPLMLENKKLQNPRLLGSGGGGAVFGFDGSSVIVKISWSGSSESVQRECSVLQALEQNHHVEGVETCLGMAPYADDMGRVLVVLQPLMEDAVASVKELKNEELQICAVQQIMRTFVQMLAAKVVTVDVQPLISTTTGNVLFIDMTEAKILEEPLSNFDVAVVSSFCNEIMALIPEQLEEAATKVLQEELRALDLRGGRISNQVYDVLREQLSLSGT